MAPAPHPSYECTGVCLPRVPFWRIRIRTERIFNSPSTYKHWLKGVSSPFLLPLTPLIQRMSPNPEASKAASVPRKVSVCARV